MLEFSSRPMTPPERPCRLWRIPCRSRSAARGGCRAGAIASSRRSRLRRGRFVARLRGDLGGARFDCDLARSALAAKSVSPAMYEPPVTRVFRGITRPWRATDRRRRGELGLLHAARGRRRRRRRDRCWRSSRIRASSRRWTRNVALNGFTHVRLRAGGGLGRGRPRHAHRLCRRGRQSRRVTHSLARTNRRRRFEVRAARPRRADRGVAARRSGEDRRRRRRRPGARGDARTAWLTARYRAVTLELHPTCCARRRVDPRHVSKPGQTMATAAGRSTVTRPPIAARSARDTSDRRACCGPWTMARHGWPHQLWLAPGESLLAC